MATTIFSLGILYFVSRLCTRLFERFQIPDVLLLMIIGLILGPLTSIVSPDSFGLVGRVLTTISLALILFEGGTDIDLKSLKRSAGPTSRLTFPFFAMTLILGTAFFYLAWPFFNEGPVAMIHCLIFGSIVAGTSSAVVIPLVNQLKPEESIKNSLVLESALTDVLCIVAAFAFLEATLNTESVSVHSIGISALSSFSLAALIGLIAGFGWALVWKNVIEMKSSIFSTVAFVFVLYGLTELLGLSGGISMLVFGLTLANYQRLPPSLLRYLGENLPSLSTDERNLLRELVFLLKTFFFIYLGINMNLADWRIQVFALLFLALLYFVRNLWCRVSLRGPAVSARDRAISAILIPKGLAAAVLAGIPSQMGLASGKIIEASVYAIVLQSILISSFLIWFTEKRARP